MLVISSVMLMDRCDAVGTFVDGWDNLIYYAYTGDLSDCNGLNLANSQPSSPLKIFMAGSKDICTATYRASGQTNILGMPCCSNREGCATSVHIRICSLHRVWHHWLVSHLDKYSPMSHLLSLDFLFSKSLYSQKEVRSFPLSPP